MITIIIIIVVTETPILLNPYPPIFKFLKPMYCYAVSKTEKVKKL